MIYVDKKLNVLNPIKTMMLLSLVALFSGCVDDDNVTAQQSEQHDYLTLNTQDFKNVKLVPSSEFSAYWVQTKESIFVATSEINNTTNVNHAEQLLVNGTISNNLKPSDIENNQETILSDVRIALVEVGFIIDLDGKTSNFEVVKSDGMTALDEKALAAASQLKFKKVVVETPIYTTWTFRFVL